jgi:hypothetical protein
MPPALKRYWATHSRKTGHRKAARVGNPTRRRTHHRAKRRNAMPPALARYWRTHRRGGTAFWPTTKARAARRRKRNPILGLSTSGLMGMLKDSAIQALGSVAVDLAYGQVNKFLPVSMQTQPGVSVGVGDAVKAVFTVIVGTVLNRPTRGLARQAAIGSLTIQLRGITESLMPAAMVQQMAGLAWATPSAVIRGQRWVGPNRMATQRHAMAAYVARPMRPSPFAGHAGPLLTAYTHSPGASSRGHFLLTGAPGMPNIASNVVSVPSGISMH